MSDTTNCHTNNTHDDSVTKQSPAVKTAPPAEGNELKTDPGSPVAYQLVEQVGFK